MPLPEVEKREILDIVIVLILQRQCQYFVFLRILGAYTTFRRFKNFFWLSHTFFFVLSAKAGVQKIKMEI